MLRDSYGVAQVRFVTGNKILRILKAKALAPSLPEDLYSLIKKAVAVRKHLERNRKVRPTQSDLHWASKETYHFSRATLIKIQSTTINHNWAQISYSTSYQAHIKNQMFDWVKKE